MPTRTFILVALTLYASASFAQQPAAGALELRTVVEKVEQRTEPDGEVKTELVPVATALPGDEVVYTVSFKNVGDQRADNILITNPIPEQMHYLGDSVFAPGIEVNYSIDGGAHYGTAEELVVQDEQGGQRLAAASEYTHIRWRLTTPLDAGAQGFARFRAVVR